MAPLAKTWTTALSIALLLPALSTAQDDGAPEDGLPVASAKTAAQSEGEEDAEHQDVPAEEEELLGATEYDPQTIGSGANRGRLDATETWEGGPEARAFVDVLQQAVLADLDVQSYERRTLGKQDIDSLAGYRLSRRIRIDHDQDHFRDRVQQLAFRPLRLAMPVDSSVFSSDEIAFMRRLQRVYESTRKTRDLELMMEANAAFLRSTDWRHRDTAVRSRDHVIDREITLNRLASQSLDMMLDGVSASTLEDMVDALDEIAPRVAGEQDDLAIFLLEDEALRARALSELGTILARPRPDLLPSQPERALARDLEPLIQALHDASGLTDVEVELRGIETEIEQLDTQLEDRGVNMLPPPERREATKRRAELSVLQTKLQDRWLQTRPALEQAQGVLETQDALLRHRIFGLGPAGALFCHRYDELDLPDDFARLSPASTWHLIASQAELLAAIDEARPPPDPLEGLAPPPRNLPQKSLLQKLKLAPRGTLKKPALFKPIPKPKKSKGKRP